MKNVLRWAIVPSIFFVDRALKIWVLSSIREGEGLVILPNILHITRVNNTGAAFGLWRGGTLWLIGVTALAVLVMACYLLLSRRNYLGWAMVLAGAMGNLFDRVHYGYVVDFIDLRVWPVFNVADTSICLGVAWILWSAFRAPRPA